MSGMTIVGLVLAGVGVLAMIEDGRRAPGAVACLVLGLALAALGTRS